MDTTLVLQAPKWMLILTDTTPTYIKELKVVLDVFYPTSQVILLAMGVILPTK